MKESMVRKKEKENNNVRVTKKRRNENDIKEGRKE